MGQRIPIVIGDKVVGEAEVEVTADGHHIVSSKITDPAVIKLLQDKESDIAVSVKFTEGE